MGVWGQSSMGSFKELRALWGSRGSSVELGVAAGNSGELWEGLRGTLAAPSNSWELRRNRGSSVELEGASDSLTDILLALK